ncbi:MAG: ankyrin repeat domain-containing protein [Acidobacteriota bacterium]
MTELFCKTEPPTEAARAFVEGVKTGDAMRLHQLLADDPELRSQIDEPWFEFDRPAIVFVARNLALVDVLLQHGADINARSQWDAGGFGVLDGADPELAEQLIARGAVVDVHAAAALGNMARLRQLVEAEPKLVHALGGDGQRPLHFARGRPAIDFLLDHGAELEARDVDHGATAAQYAVGQDMEKCRYLIERGAVVDLLMACALGDEVLVESVLEQEPDALRSRLGACSHTKPGQDGHIYRWNLRGATTPLEVADTFGHRALFDDLLARSPRLVRFATACWFGDESPARELLQERPGLVGELPEEQQAMMARAAWEHRTATVRLLLDLGFDPHLTWAEQSTPLDRAAFHGFADIVELLLATDPAPPLTTFNAYDSPPLGTCVYGAVHSWRDDGDHATTAEALLRAGSRYRESWLPTGSDAMDTVLAKYPENRLPAS